MSETNAMQPARRGAAMVLFSGGQDSTTCLAWALSRFERVETLGFDYGQRHAVELECRKTVLEKLRAFRPEWVQRLGEDHMLDMGLLGQISDCALTPQGTFCSSRLRPRSLTEEALKRSWAACAKPTIPDMPTAATTH